MASRNGTTDRLTNQSTMITMKFIEVAGQLVDRVAQFDSHSIVATATATAATSVAGAMLIIILSALRVTVSQPVGRLFKLEAAT